jgi:small multidrug resistance pump
MHFVYLAIAIISEVVATSALKATEEFTKPGPSLLVLIGYGLAFYFLTLSLRVIPVGIAYAIWAGVGVVLVALVSAVLYKQLPDMPAMVGMAMIVGGVVVIQLFSKSIHQ